MVTAGKMSCNRLGRIVDKSSIFLEAQGATSRAWGEWCLLQKGNRKSPILGDCIHFVKFETIKLNDCLDFIHSKNFHLGKNLNAGACEESDMRNNIIKAIGGGAFKYAKLFKEKLGVTLDKEDEMDYLVAGEIFLLKAI